MSTGRFLLSSLQAESATWRTSTGEALREFIRGRGLTLLLATMISLAIWLVAKGLLKAYWRWLYRSRHDIDITRAPLVLYSYRLVVAVIHGSQRACGECIFQGTAPGTTGLCGNLQTRGLDFPIYSDHSPFKPMGCRAQTAYGEYNKWR